tara:strand:+ start:420 stop:1253 length:834 start_codon:yes stop_codon:yes gene_type:complete
MKIFRRPMFRKGGSTNEGVMTGITDRENFAAKGIDDATMERIKAREDLFRSITAPRGGEALSNLLIRGGLNLISGTGEKGLKGVATAFQKPTEQFMQESAREDQFGRQLGLAAATGVLGEEAKERIATITARNRKLTNYQSMLNNKLIGMFGKKDSYSQAEIAKANDAVQSFMKQGTAKDVLTTISDLNDRFDEQGYPNPLRAAQVFTQYKGNIVLVPPRSYKYDKGFKISGISEDFKKIARPGTTYYDSFGDRFIQIKKMDDNTVQMIEVPAPEIK